MKTLDLLTLAVLYLLNFSSTKAQSPAYEKSMKEALSTLDSAHSQMAYSTTANRFEQIAQDRQQEWLPFYYAAYARLMTGISSQEEKQKDLRYMEALSLLEKAEEQQTNNSEIFALKGYIRYMQIALKPMERYQDSDVAEADLDMALALDPTNPRVYLIRGQNTFYTPQQYGGGKAAAKPLLVKAKALFEKSTDENMLYPHWGKERVDYLLQQ